MIVNGFHEKEKTFQGAKPQEKSYHNFQRFILQNRYLSLTWHLKRQQQEEKIWQKKVSNTKYVVIIEKKQQQPFQSLCAVLKQIS